MFFNGPFKTHRKNPKLKCSYYNDLCLRASLKGALGERSNETIGASARESSGELSLNSSDAGSETFDRDVALSMVASEQEALDEIEDAIDRIFDGTYGVCQETQKPIKKARLKAVPFTRFSLEGQAQYEGRKTKDRESTSGVLQPFRFHYDKKIVLINLEVIVNFGLFVVSFVLDLVTKSCLPIARLLHNPIVVFDWLMGTRLSLRLLM